MSANPNSPFRIGAYRPIYLWGGPGTIRMNRLKFMDQPVDEAAHHLAHAPEGARVVLEDMRANWVHLTYDWGFPPEIEQEDWEDFRRAAAVYHAAGSPVFAYIQTSNCVYSHSYRQRDWYALDPHGRKIFYYSGRYMCCLMHPEWRAHLREMVRGAIEAGADGIFLDNLWHGAMPDTLFKAWLGAPGCHCPRCQETYRAAAGEDIPRETRPELPAVQRYLRWRAVQVTALVKELRDYARQLKPGTPLSANDYEMFTRDTYLIYGQDLGALAQVQDVVMIENHALPHWQPGPHARLANNALVIRNCRPVVAPHAHLSVLSYHTGIGFDGAYPPRRYQLELAEAAACGASVTTKGTEYFQDGQHTTLAAAQFAPVHHALGSYHRWLEEHDALYAEGHSAAPVGLRFPGEALWFGWLRLARLYQGAGQALTAAGIPWRAVTGPDDLGGLRALLVFDEQSLKGLSLPEDVRVVRVPALPGWQLPQESLVSRWGALRRLASAVTHGLMNVYFSSRAGRKVMDRLGMAKLVTQSPVFDLPTPQASQALLAALPTHVYPRAEAAEPALIEVWQRAGQQQVHLVNYAPQPQMVKVVFAHPVRARVISPDGPGEQAVTGKEIALQVDIYSVLLVEDEGQR